MTIPRLAAAALLAALSLPRSARAAEPVQAAPVPSHAAPGAAAADRKPSPEFTAAVVAYPITLDRVERYAKAIKALRTGAETDPALRADLAKPRRKGANLDAAAAQLDAMPKVKAVLAKHGLTGRDFLLIPQVVLSSRSARFAEKEGHPVPADKVNAAGLALHRSHWEQLDQLTMGFMADVKALGPR